MKILHMCLASFYIDNYSYQENMLPKYHKKMGLEVEILASLVSFDKNGASSLLESSSSYNNEFGIPVTRLDYRKSKISKKLRQYQGTYEAINKSKPDIIFVHGCQFHDIRYVVKYVKENPKVKVYVDNHADFSNSATNWLSKNILHKIIWRKCAQLIKPYTQKFYGVLPARVEFLKDVYKVPENKAELLLMGADDEEVEEAKNPYVKNNIRKKYNIKSDDFLIVTGGKIDRSKKQTLLLMEAVKEIDNPKVKLIVFGSVVKELQDEVNSLADGDYVKYIGWIDAEDSYNYFGVADLVIFPGRHSVFWEQVAGLGIPMIVKHWDGTTHVDIGGNCDFLYNDSVDEIYVKIKDLLDNPKRYNQMKYAAENSAKKNFSYSEIAKRSIAIKSFELYQMLLQYKVLKQKCVSCFCVDGVGVLGIMVLMWKTKQIILNYTNWGSMSNRL